MNILEDLKIQYKMGGFEQKIIYWNISTFLISIVFFYQFKLGFFDFPSWISLSSNWETVLFAPWTLLSYLFFPIFQYGGVEFFWSNFSHFLLSKAVFRIVFVECFFCRNYF